MSRPTPQEYADALSSIKLTEGQTKLLKQHSLHQSLHDEPATCPELAKAADYKDYRGVNSAYSKLGIKIARNLNWEIPESPATLIVSWIYPQNRQDCWRCTLQTELFGALQILGWVPPRNLPSSRLFPNEVDESLPLHEGAVSRVLVNAYERNPKARQECINHYGTSCFVCGFSFGEVFGKLGEGFIHVHHLLPISEAAEKREVNPIQDLRPVCPNCHAMLHRLTCPSHIEELQKILQRHDS